MSRLSVSHAKWITRELPHRRHRERADRQEEDRQEGDHEGDREEGDHEEGDGEEGDGEEGDGEEGDGEEGDGEEGDGRKGNPPTARMSRRATVTGAHRSGQTAQSERSARRAAPGEWRDTTRSATRIRSRASTSRQQGVDLGSRASPDEPQMVLITRPSEKALPASRAHGS